MKPADCSKVFEAVIEFGNIRATFPLSLLEEFLNKKVIKAYEGITVKLIEKYFPWKILITIALLET